MRRTLRWLMCAVVLSAGAYSGVVLATPPSGFTSTTLSLGRFDEIDVHNSDRPNSPWQSKQKTKDLSDVYVQSNVWAPGGTSGWHTHPGHSLITVTAGTVTAYHGDDPSCTPTVYTPGMGFVDPGGDHVHVLRNEGAVEARTITVQLIPAGAARRIDAEDPGHCPF
jgi:Cupin domain